MSKPKRRFEGVFGSGLALGMVLILCVYPNITKDKVVDVHSSNIAYAYDIHHDIAPLGDSESLEQNVIQHVQAEASVQVIVDIPVPETEAVVLDASSVQEEATEALVEPISQGIPEQRSQTISVAAAPKTEIKESTGKTYNGVSEGDIFNETKVTRYCACTTCCGYKTEFWTAGGTLVWNGMDDPYIVACNWLPLGSQVKIDGVEYTVNDKGGARRLSQVGQLDLFTPGGHAECFRLGNLINVEIEIVYINT